MPVKKYTDFTESDAVERRGKHPPHVVRSFVDIMCPHCNEVCAEIPVEHVKTSKASMCLQHLRVCTAYDGEVPAAKKQRVTNEDLLRKLDQMRKEAEEREQRIIKTISEKIELGPPPPTDEESLYQRVSEKHAEETRLKTEMECCRSNMDNWNHVGVCSVCMDKSCDTLFNPCAHRNTCWADWKTLEASAVASGVEPKCPTCRIVIKGAVRLVV